MEIKQNFPKQTSLLGEVAGEEAGECVLAASIDIGGGVSLLCPAHHLSTWL